MNTSTSNITQQPVAVRDGFPGSGLTVPERFNSTPVFEISSDKVE